MSSSDGLPSNKIGWYKKMMAKMRFEDQISEEAKRAAKNPSYKTKFKEGKKSNKLFADSLEVEQKLDNKRKRKEHKHKRGESHE
jgi:hypothetical protein